MKPHHPGYRSRPARAWSAVPVLAAAGLLAACGEPPEKPAPQPTEVAVITVEPRDVPFIVNRVAQAESSRQVEVVARVSGFLDEIAYQEGVLVEEGQVMFEMDRAPFQAQLDAARGELQASKARLLTANANLDRTRPLAEADALSQSDLDQAVGEQKAAEAAVYAAQAAVKTAELNLGYATIRAPVTGLAGRALQREGAFLNAQSESANLTFVAQVDPIWVNFSVSQNELAKVRRQERAGTLVPPEGNRYQVEVVMSDGEVYPELGLVDFADPTLDQRTGTFMVRSVVPNPDATIMPGMFVTARLIGATRPNAIVVPQKAVQQSPNGHIVWLVKDKGVAEARPVVTGDWIGEDWIIEQGLSGGETLIVEGFQRLGPGAPVKPVPAGAGAPAAASR